MEDKDIKELSETIIDSVVYEKLRFSTNVISISMKGTFSPCGNYSKMNVIFENKEGLKEEIFFYL